MDMVNVEEKLIDQFNDMDLGPTAGALLIDDDGVSESESGETTREVTNRATKVRSPPEPPPGVERGARVQDIYFDCLDFLMLCPPPMRFYYFVIWILVTVFVAMCVSLFGILAFLHVISYVWIFGNRDGCVKPGTWLAIRVALSRVTVFKSHHRVYSRSCWCLFGVRFVFHLIDVMILKLMI
ncbi:unnamed protein product [Cuscuta epithymum]|uniref:Uncharacterized protein n=1 Tax=Cuscuta epithymum TaxID=186058 RepID=A0AAV0GD24_9ASTE|nr:unnamed protein product [Cuscuta epithymum]